MLLDNGKWLRTGIVLSMTSPRRIRRAGFQYGWTPIRGTCVQSRTVRKRSFPRRSPGRSWKHSICSHRRMRCTPVSSICCEITLVVLTGLKINSNNVFLSLIDSASPVLELGDPGNRMRLEETVFTNLSHDPNDAGRFQQISHTTHWMQGV